MSVPISNRNEAKMEFLKNARDIEIIFIDFRINKPKRYTFFFDKLLDLAIDLLNSLKIGNSIMPTNSLEAEIRTSHFKVAIGKCQALVSQIEILRKKYEDDGLSMGQVKQLAEMLQYEIKLIKGLIASDKKRYKNLSDNKSEE